VKFSTLRARNSFKTKFNSHPSHPLLQGGIVKKKMTKCAWLLVVAVVYFRIQHSLAAVIDSAGVEVTSDSTSVSMLLVSSFYDDF